MKKMNPVVHFEMPTEDRKRMVEFYSNVFGWQTQLIKESSKEVTKAGGKVLGEPMEIPGVGQYVSFIDTEGNRVSLLQPAMPGA